MAFALRAVTRSCAARASCWVGDRPALAQLRVADLARDADMLDEVRATAAHMLQVMPERIAALRTRWIGEREQYGRVG